MKKSIITLVILFGMAIGAFAQGGLFGMGPTRECNSYEYASNRDGMINLPSSHGTGTDQTGDPAPLGSGVIMLASLGAAYAMMKRKNK